ncbi:MAG TPA: PRC-barrel domain-containing protein [Alphaproteobacteria bacterium]|nr:PRC-barrel domain-containing protein [Alphaproteobacteria bacterium]
MRKLTQDATRAFLAVGLALAPAALCRPSLAADAHTNPNAAPAQNDAFRHDLKASDVMSSDVRDASGHYIGKAEDLLLDATSGRIMAAVINVKDFFGVTTKKIVLPIQDLKISGQLTTTLDRQKLLAETPAGE